MIDPLTGQEQIPPVIDPTATTAPTTGLINAPVATAETPAAPASTSATQDPVYGAPTTQGWNVTKDQTVEGRIKGIIDQNSPLMEQAQTQGLQQAASRGLLNSSMAVGAAQDSLYKAATPIATADANIQANAAQFNALDPNKQAAIKASADQQMAELATRKDLSQADIVARKDQLVTEIISREGLAEKDRVAVAARLDKELQSRERIANLDNDARVLAAGKDAEYKLLIAQNQGAAGLYDTYQKAINAINTSTLDTANKQRALDDQFAILQAGMQMYTDVDGLNIDQIIAPVAGGSTAGPGANPGGGAAAVTADLSARQSAYDAEQAQILQDMEGKTGLAWYSLQARLNKMGARPA